MIKLHFAKGNAKLNKETAVFSLPAGWSCPFSLLCKSQADEKTGKITDGQKCQFRCFAVSSENLFRNVRISRWNNFRALLEAKTCLKMADLLLNYLPKNISVCRVHSSGDFFSQDYFDAWLLVAKSRKDTIFYAYTKAIPYWINRLGKIPSNFRLTASRGGMFDSMIDKYGLKNVRVVFSKQEAEKLHLPIDHDDSFAWQDKGNFALLLHGTQLANSLASKALYQLRRQKIGGYRADYFGHYTKKRRGTFAKNNHQKNNLSSD